MSDSPPISAARSLLSRRLIIVTGKGGTGKTTVVASLALAAAAAGRRVLAVEVGRDEQLHRLIAPGTPPVGHAGRLLRPELRVMQIDPFESLAEYLAIQLGVRAVSDRVVRNKGFRQLMSASPGWRELITLGKIWHLEQAEEPEGRPLHDLIVVDAPATGHGLTFLDVPRVVVSAVRAGPLHAHTEAVEALMEDPDRTLLLPVTLAEELPTRETAELVERVRGSIGVPVDRVVVNALLPPPFPPELPRLDEVLARVPGAESLAACARFLRARYELNAHYTGEIAARTALPIVPLPYRTEGISGPEDLAVLGEALLAEPEALAA